MTTKEQQVQSVKCQQAIAEIVDEFLRDGMRPDWIREILEDEAGSVLSRADDLAEAAYDRHQERLMENGPGPTLLDQQIAAQKFK